MLTVEYDSLSESETLSYEEQAVSDTFVNDDEDIVVDYIGKELFVNDKVKFVVEVLDGEEEYWVGHITNITGFSADADDDGDWYGVLPQVVIEYSFLGTTEVESFNTFQHSRKSNIFICEELELISERNYE